MSIQEDWVVLDDSERGKIITDIVILAKKEGVPDKYTLVRYSSVHNFCIDLVSKLMSARMCFARPVRLVPLRSLSKECDC